MKKIAFALTLALSINLPSFAQPSNDFFGSSLPGSSSNNPPPGVTAAEQALANPTSGDYTADEKRMHKKYKANLLCAQKLIAKADKMMKAGEKQKNDKVLKKGRILKEIGEKRLTELKENNPLPGNTR